MSAQGKAARDPERTAAAVLEAAESLFAEKGYDAVSLGEIGRKAGVSRGTPSYLFGSKKGLYRAVVERIAEDVKDFVAGTRPHTEVGVAGRSPEDAIAYGIGAYVDFLASRPNFVRLMEREVLDAGRLSEGGSEEVAGLLTKSLGDPGTGFLAEDLRRGPFREVDARQLGVSIIALCFFPFAHAGGLMKELGLNPQDPTFLEERKRHVIDLVLRGILAPEQRGG